MVDLRSCRIKTGRHATMVLNQELRGLGTIAAGATVVIGSIPAGWGSVGTTSYVYFQANVLTTVPQNTRSLELLIHNNGTVAIRNYTATAVSAGTGTIWILASVSWITNS